MRLAKILFLVAAILSMSSMAYADSFAAADDGSITVKVTSETDEDLASEFLSAASAYRQDIAQEWLGRELKVGEGRILFLIEEVDDPKQEFAQANIYRQGDRITVTIKTVEFDNPLMPGTLQHEIAHCVLDFIHHNDLPRWVHEGIAMRYNHNLYHKHNKQIVAELLREDQSQVHKLHRVLTTPHIDRLDFEGYAVSTSLVDYLLSLGSKQYLLTFASQVNDLGLERALYTYYRVQNIAHLEYYWRKYAEEKQQ